ncbi:MAG: cysteine--tRNA ligase [Patescibacteria group bacterium]|nr:cysteine--tRNA ligase [Patescibacteria group bacterium]
MIRIFNTISRKKEVIKPKKLKLFVCGPTVYDSSHLGHARTYIIFDIIVKYLRYAGFNVSYLINITDIDDKIIQRAKEQNKEPNKLALEFEKSFLKDMKSLGIDSPDKYARATSYIKEIISQIERLIKKGYAYELKDGIYYDISKFKDYGKLSGRTKQGAEDAVSRIDEAKDKRNKGDFALWKLSKKGEPKWDSPWGEGRPGWHIEDTAITEKEFGVQYDMHGGAIDLIFPHHEAEISQMEAISGKSPLVRYWIHSGLLRMEKQKMSKSLNNFITIEEFLKDHPARLLRYLVSKTSYRSPLQYSERRIEQAEKELERIDEFIGKLNDSQKGKENNNILKEFKLIFKRSMEDDFNTPLVLTSLLYLIKKSNSLIAKEKFSTKDSQEILLYIKKIDKIFGFIIKEKDLSIPENIKKLAQKREDLRNQKKYKEADLVRNKLIDMGWKLQDTNSGYKIQKI